MPAFAVTASFEIVLEAPDVKTAQRYADGLRIPAPGEIPYIDVLEARWTKRPSVDKPR